jgi:tRNA(Ser,Leu) C12 N-acetylase TAN1
VQAGRAAVDLLTEVRKFAACIWPLSSSLRRHEAVQQIREMMPELYAEPAKVETADAEQGEGEERTGEEASPTDASAGVSATSAPPTAASTIADELEAELAALRGVVVKSDAGTEGEERMGKRARGPNGEARPVKTLTCKYDQLCRAVCIVWLPRAGVDVTPVIDRIMTTATEERRCPLKSTSRLIPVQLFTGAHIDSIKTGLSKLVNGAFKPERPTTWGAEIRIRNNTSLSRMDVLRVLRELIPSSHMVDLCNPETTVLVEVCQSTAGLSMLNQRRFQKFANYNIQLLAETPEEKDARLAHAASCAVKSAEAKVRAVERRGEEPGADEEPEATVGEEAAAVEQPAADTEVASANVDAVEVPAPTNTIMMVPSESEP